MKRQIVRESACALAVALLFLAIGWLPAAAQGQEPKPFTAEELEQIVAPIALYSDGLLAQVFMASTYPVEIVQAARFLKANPNLKDQALTDELKKYDWDDSVKFMVGVPQALNMMDEKLDWLQKLGDAFLGQRKETMDAVQRLRAKAHAEGNLKTTPEQKVSVQPAAAPPAAPAAPGGPAAPAAAPTQQTIVIEQADPQVVYVPTYNPTVVYGGWPYPAYPPYAYYPPGYVAGAAISFGFGMAMGAAIWGGCNWGGGDVDIDVNKNNNFNKNVNRESRQRTTQGGSGGRQNFQHNPEHRKGAQYRDQGSQQRYNKQGPAGAEGRQDFRGRGEGGAGRGEAGRGDAGRGGGASVSDRGDAGRGGGASVSDRGDAGRGGGASVSDRSRGDSAGGGRDVSGGSRGGGSAGGSAFQGMDRGGAERGAASRGQSSFGGSRSSGGGFSGGGGSRASTGGGSRGGGGRGGGRR